MMESKSAGGPAIETQKSARTVFMTLQKRLTWWCLGPLRRLQHVLDDQLTESGAVQELWFCLLRGLRLVAAGLGDHV